MHIRKFIAPVVIAFTTLAAHADPMAYFTNLYQQFGIVNLATGSYQTIGPGTPEAGAGLVPGAGGSLLTLTVSGNLDAIDPATGLQTVVGATGLGGQANTLAGLGGILYATDLANNLYTVNPLTGLASLVGPTGIPVVPAYPFTVNPDGTTNLFDETLYASGGKLYTTFDAFRLGTDGTVTPVVTPNLWTIDTTTGAASVIAATSLQLLASVEIGGTFYTLHGAFDEENPAGFSQSMTLDLTNGKTSFITNIDPAAGPIFALSPVLSPVPSPVPEPSSLALMGTGILAVAAKLRRR
ncbi:hypothetical protein BH10ACI4_BH10ACI4_33670 [soil metagenome]